MKLPFFKKKPSGTEITLQLNGLHCTSCSLNIDGALEETEGVLSASTSYRTQQTRIAYDPTAVHPDQLKKVIEALGYQITTAA
jgi:Cu+-exporting ATPase